MNTFLIQSLFAILISPALAKVSPACLTLAKNIHHTKISFDEKGAGWSLNTAKIWTSPDYQKTFIISGPQGDFEIPVDPIEIRDATLAKSGNTVLSVFKLPRDTTPYALVRDNGGKLKITPTKNVPNLFYKVLGLPLVKSNSGTDKVFSQNIAVAKELPLDKQDGRNTNAVIEALHSLNLDTDFRIRRASVRLEDFYAAGVGLNLRDHNDLLTEKNEIKSQTGTKYTTQYATQRLKIIDKQLAENEKKLIAMHTNITESPWAQAAKIFEKECNTVEFVKSLNEKQKTWVLKHFSLLKEVPNRLRGKDEDEDEEQTKGFQ